jgi:hypothetical protein
VRLWGSPFEHLGSHAGLSDPAATARVRDDGTFAMDGVGHGIWTLEVDVEGGSRLFTTVAMSKGRASERVVAVVGATSVEGRVFDRLGRTVQGAVVQVSASPQRLATPQAFVATTVTDRDGRYRVTRLVSAGPSLVSARLPDPASGLPRSVLADLRPGRTNVVDVGSEVEEPELSGVVRGRGGRPVQGPGALWLEREGRTVYESERVDFDVEGRFSQRVPAGSYLVSVELPGGEHRRIGAASRLLVEDSSPQDVVVSGARLEVTVRDSTSGALLPLASRARLVLVPEAKRRFGGLDLVFVSDGRFLADGLAPGRYRIERPFRRVTDSSGRSATVEILESGPDLALDLLTSEE